MLTVNTTDLNVVLVSNSIECVLLCHKLGEIDVNRSSESSTKISRAGCNISEVIVLSEFTILLNSLSSSAKSIKDLLNTSTLLHGNDSKLILLVDPDEESLGIVVEDTTTRGPITVEITSLEEPVSFPKKNKSDICCFNMY